MIIKWNELVLDYNILKMRSEEKCDMNSLIDRYENDVNTFYSQFEDYFSQNRKRNIFGYNN